MSFLHYRDDCLCVEDVSLIDIARTYGTPTYVYSKQALLDNITSFKEAFENVNHRLCFAVKANSNLSILRLLSEHGIGFDIVSAGELQRVLKATGQAKNVVFSGVGKTEADIKKAIEHDILCFNVESFDELHRINQLGIQANKVIDVAIRVNPDIHVNTHQYISTGRKENKFGIDTTDLTALFATLDELTHISVKGIAAHIGSQITEIDPFIESINYLIMLYQQFTASGRTLAYINIGGGLGITYKDEQPPLVKDYAKAVHERLKNIPVQIILEPGRAIVGNTGILLSRIEYIKDAGDKKYAIIDAGMNDLLRPALYNAWHDIKPVKKQAGATALYDIAGPVCESSDFLGKQRELVLQNGDYLAITCTGAYGFSMSSNYNSRCKPAEILIDGGQTNVIRRREKIEDVLALEE